MIQIDDSDTNTFRIMTFLKLGKNDYLDSDRKKNRMAQNLAITKKSTILIQSSWYSSSVKYSWDEYFQQVSWRLDNNCGFLGQST